MTHIIISRMWYEKEEDLLKRITIYESNLLPALLNQTNQDFDIGILCNEKHKEIIQNIHPRIIPFFTKKKGQRMGKFWHIHSNWEDIIGIKEYDIQTNIDSDDIVSKDFVKIIKDSITEEKRILIHFQPLLRDFFTGIVKKIRINYNEKYISPCYSLYQPDKENYVYIGQDEHPQMYKYADKIIKIPEGHYWMNIHDNNDSTTMKLSAGDINIFNPEEEREKRKAQAEKLKKVIEAYKIRNPIKYKQKEKELMDKLNSLL